MKHAVKQAEQMKASRRRRLGGSSVEYVLVLALVVIPLALMVPMLLRMISIYTHRITWNITLPFG